MVNPGTGCIVHRNVKNRCAGNDARIKISPNIPLSYKDKSSSPCKQNPSQ